MNIAHFGEIVGLDSRAVWYSDEEDDDDGVVDDFEQPITRTVPLNTNNSHEVMRSDVTLSFRKAHLNPLPDLKFSSCIISQASSAQYKNYKHDQSHLLGYFDHIGKALMYQIAEPNQASSQNVLWLIFDSSANFIAGQEVGYFVEKLRDLLYKEFNLRPACPILILSQQFSTGEHLEYLSNYGIINVPVELPFQGCPLQPPSLIKNQFESALFEQLTLTSKETFVICLPNPKNFWFDRTKSWPSIPDKIIEMKLTDDYLDKTLIFT